MDPNLKQHDPGAARRARFASLQQHLPGKVAWRQRARCRVGTAFRLPVWRWARLADGRSLLFSALAHVVAAPIIPRMALAVQPAWWLHPAMVIARLLSVSGPPGRGRCRHEPEW